MERDRANIKILAFGDVEGQFDTLFKLINAYNKKAGPFEVVFAIGEFFGPSASDNEKLLTGQYKSPSVPVYVLGPCTSKTAEFYPPSSAEIAENVTYLGSRGQLTLACGLSVAFLSGVANNNQTDWTFNEETINQLIVPATAASGFRGIDVFLTSEWPQDAHRYCTQPPSEPIDGSALISKVVSVLKPRYHISALHNVHYERQPYRNHRILQEAAAHCTRLIGLAKVNNREKRKFVYAFNIKPMKFLKHEQLVEQPPDAGEYPYAQAVNTLIKAAEQRRQEQHAADMKQQNFFFDADVAPEEETGRRSARKRQMGPEGEGAFNHKRQPQGPCWFCLSNADVEKHLIVSIGDSCYIALPKGPLTAGHMLIVPVGHVQSMTAAEPIVRQEAQRFKDALQKCMREKYAKECVFFERNYRTQHAQINAVPVQANQSMKMKEIFMKMAEDKGFELRVPENEVDIYEEIGDGVPYFLVETPDGNKLFTRQMRNFPIHFGREILCCEQVLNLPDRIDWKNVKMEKSAEKTLVEKFRETFAKYDFTLEDD